MIFINFSPEEQLIKEQPHLLQYRKLLFWLHQITARVTAGYVITHSACLLAVLTPNLTSSLPCLSALMWPSLLSQSVGFDPGGIMPD